MDFAPQTLTLWLASHPHWILASIALLAFLESLALVGVVVPGVALLLAAATLAGSNGIAILPVLAAGFAGAVLGDGISFLLGYRYHHSIRRLPPFSTHPQWITKGEQFFHRYGLAGIVAGRFVGPIRPVMPLVAGLMQMRPLHFFTINLLSALAWSPFYLMPGYLLGLSIEGPSALSYQHLILLAAIFITGWLLAQSGLWLQHHIHTRASKRLLALGLVLVCSFLLILLGIAARHKLLSPLDEVLAQQIFNLRHVWLDPVFVGISIMGEYPPMVLWAACVTLALLLQRNVYGAALWAGFTLLGQLLISQTKAVFEIARPALITAPPVSASFPSGHTGMALIFIGLLASLLLPSVNARRRPLILSAAAVLVTTSAASRLYLGVHWFSDIIGGILAGALVLALFYLAVLTRPFQRIKPIPLLLATALAWVIAATLLAAPAFAEWVERYQPLLVG